MNKKMLMLLTLSLIACGKKDLNYEHDHSVLKGEYFAGEHGHSKHVWSTRSLINSFERNSRGKRKFVRRGIKKIVLTYDDHPAKKTDALLDLLKKRNVKATFFYNTESFNKNQRILKRIVKEGHILASHNRTHKLARSLTQAEFKSDLKQSILAVEKIYRSAGIVDNKGVYFRYPYGAKQSVSVKRKVKKSSYDVMQEVGQELYGENCISYAFWDIDTIDWALRSSDKIFQNVVAQLEGTLNDPNGGKGFSWKRDRTTGKSRVHKEQYNHGLEGGIILMHDKGKKYAINATEKIIDWSKENGYSIIHLSDVDGFNFDDRKCRLLSDK